MSLRLPSFETRPIRDIYEYQHLRELANMENNRKFKQCKKKGLSEQEISDLLLAHSLNDPVNRRIMWEFRKRLAKKIPNNQTTWTPAQQAGLQKLKLYYVDLKKKKISEFEWLFKNEARVVTDIKTRNRARKEIMADMEAAQMKYEQSSASV